VSESGGKGQGKGSEERGKRVRLVVAGPISLVIILVAWAIMFGLLTCSVPEEFGRDAPARPADERLAPVLGPDAGDPAGK